MESNPATPLPRNPISLSPSGIPLPRRPQDEVYTRLRINNKCDDFVYGLSILLSVTGNASDAFTLELEEVNPALELLERGGLQLSLDLFGLSVSDPLGNAYHLLLLHTAAPRTVYTVPLTFRVNAETDEPAIAAVALAYFSDRPESILTQPSELFPGWTETLVKVNLFGEFKWIGLATSPPFR